MIILDTIDVVILEELPLFYYYVIDVWLML